MKEPRYFNSIEEYEKWWEEELNKAQKQNEKELPPNEAEKAPRTP